MKIEKGIPIPLKTRETIFGEMEVGDSVFFELPIATVNSRIIAWRNASKNTWKFTSRGIDGGTRTWRIE